MVIDKFCSIQTIIEKVLRNTGYQEIALDDVLEYTAEVMGLFGMPLHTLDEITRDVSGNPYYVEVENFKCDIPINSIKVNTIREWYSKRNLLYTTDNFYLNLSEPKGTIPGITGYGTDIGEYTNPDGSGIVNTSLYDAAVYNSRILEGYMTAASATPLVRAPKEIELKYCIKNGVIYTSFKEGKVEIAYKTYALDENGYPMIPDNEYYKRLISSYIQMKLDYRLFRQGKLTQAIYQDSQQQYWWAIKSAKGVLSIPDPNKMESLKNMMIRLIPDKNMFASGFKFAAERERYWHQ